ncbi:hypothetical protein BFJ63_vAg31 [Fusarium oxysporum f. sp. narcissi]|uniref:Uncharacterized protein n=1 Tax=Fusarium oxysporum f. sp. narcissi TaxID=451672 RepID=A0A4Q2WBH9_FUSOX|nr:hypothetical protein BFJ63_vAg31 [Fusarium oxysporum f. sp. narcissi]
MKSGVEIDGVDSRLGYSRLLAKSDAKSQYLYLVQELKKLGSLAYLSLVEAKGDPAIFFANASAEDDKTLDFILEAWNN